MQIEKRLQSFLVEDLKKNKKKLKKKLKKIFILKIYYSFGFNNCF